MKVTGNFLTSKPFDVAHIVKQCVYCDFQVSVFRDLNGGPNNDHGMLVVLFFNVSQ